MTIVHYVANYSLQRGLERQAFLQASTLNRLGHNCELWTLTLPDDFSNQKSIDFVVKCLSPSFIPAKEITGAFNVLMMFLFTNIKSDCRVIHIHGLSRFCLVFFLVSKLFDQRLVVKLSNSGQKSVFKKLELAGPISRLTLKLAKRCVSQWICLNQTNVNELKDLSIPSYRINIVYNMCQPPSNIPSKKSYDKNQGLNILIVGSLQNHKNPYLSVLVSNYLKKYKDIHFHFAGDGPCLNNLRQLAKENVQFHGRLDQKNLMSLYNLCDLYLSTSSAEGMSNSLLEAISYGLIPIVMNIEANSNVLGENYPFLVDDDAHKICESILSIKRNGSHSFNLFSILKNHHPDLISRSLLKVYSKN